VGSNHWPRAY